MHTFNSDTEDISFGHNGDYSGDVIITVHKRRVEDFYGTPDFKYVTVPMKDILDFVANYVRDKVLEEVENMDTADVMKLLGLATKIEAKRVDEQDRSAGL